MAKEVVSLAPCVIGQTAVLVDVEGVVKVVAVFVGP
jgi:hypothetical protein